jgi:hypothetical protein
MLFPKKLPSFIPIVESQYGATAEAAEYFFRSMPLQKGGKNLFLLMHRKKL